MGRLLAGKYELLRELAVGGMAEVYLARQTGLSGFEKLVCIKRILPERAADPEFVHMFLDEARLSADLRHPNIVDLYEIGEDATEKERTLYIAMEYVHGHSVRYIQETASFRGRGMPRSLAMQIGLEAARALHYAHTKKDLRGKPLGIVHRDVSPQNLLVTFDGATKLCDFGIAKAAGRRTATVVGMVKGKASYMSPEQATGRPLDGRSDLFALGIVLYELTTGVRLFPQSGDMGALTAVAQARVTPPTKLEKNFPASLEAILLRLLAREPKDRYPTAAAAAAAIEDWLVAEGRPPSAARMSGFLREIFPDNERETERVPAHPGAAVAEPPLAVDTEVLEGSEPTGTMPLPEPTPSHSKPAARTNIPSDAGSFVGRAKDLETLRAKFRAGERLVTLLGPGGAGKTRVATRFALESLDEYIRNGGGGAWLVDLSGARGVDDVLRAIGAALAIPLTADASALGEALSGRGRILLVLDGFENVVELAPETIARWQGSAPEARFLVTSRERLKIQGEVTHELGALSLPSNAQAAAESEAVQLFVERARAVRPDYKLTEADAPFVVHIVRTLDGLPLAIELAASRMRVFSPQKLVERLSQRFELLAGGMRDAAGRQATLRGAIDWSWSTLSRHEQAALAQASVFRGGFTLDAAEVVLDVSAWPAGEGREPTGDAPAWVPDLVQSLRDKSLLRAWTPADSGELRFAMYESIREYAAEKLAQVRGESGLLLRHGEHYVRVAGAWSESIDLHGGLARLRNLAAEAENLLAVHRRAARGASAAIGALGVRAVLALEPVFATRGPFGGFVRLCDEALGYGRAQGVDPLLLARVLTARGWMRRMAGDTAAARADFDAALTLARRAEDAGLEGRLVRLLGLVTWDEGRFEESRLEYLRALDLHRKAGDRQLEGRTLGDLANFDQEEGKLAEAQARYEEAIAILREVGDRRTEGIILGYLGVLLQERERRDAAKAMYDRAVGIQREFRDRRHEAMFVGYEGTLFHERGELEDARKAYRHAVRLSRDLGDRRQEGFYLSYLAVLDAQGDHRDDAAAEIAEAARRLESDRLLSAMIGVNRAHVELLLARAAKAPAAVARAQRAATERLADVDAAGSAGWTGADAGRSLVQASMDIRIAHRLLRRALSAA